MVSEAQHQRGGAAPYSCIDSASRASTLRAQCRYSVKAGLCPKKFGSYKGVAYKTNRKQPRVLQVPLARVSTCFSNLQETGSQNGVPFRQEGRGEFPAVAEFPGQCWRPESSSPCHSVHPGNATFLGLFIRWLKAGARRLTSIHFPSPQKIQVGIKCASEMYIVCNLNSFQE